MKKTIALILALLLIGAAALAEYAVYAIADPTYVRSAPGLNGERLANLRPDAVYEWGGHTSVDNRGVAWFDIFFGNKYGWVSSLHADLYDTQSGQLQYYENYPVPDDTTLFAKRDLDVYSNAGTGCLEGGQVPLRQFPFTRRVNGNDIWAGNSYDLEGKAFHLTRTVL